MSKPQKEWKQKVQERHRALVLGNSTFAEIFQMSPPVLKPDWIVVPQVHALAQSMTESTGQAVKS
jgi:hypothetical protein